MDVTQTVEYPFDPAPAVDASARYLAEQLRRFRGEDS
jgi:hypothetical protein